MDVGGGDELQRLRAEVADLRRDYNRTLGLAVFFVLLWAVRGVTDRLLPDNGIVTATSLHVVDDDGNLRASIGAEPLDDAALVLYDQQQRPRVRIKAADEHGTFEILDAEKHTQVRLSAIENLSGLHLANGSRSAQMVASIESTAVTLADLDESATAVLRAEPGGTDLELARNKTGEPPRLASLSAGSGDPDKGAALTLAGPLQFVQATVHPIDGEPRITLAGDTRLESRTAPSGEPWQRFERPEAPLQAP